MGAFPGHRLRREMRRTCPRTRPLPQSKPWRGRSSGAGQTQHVGVREEALPRGGCRCGVHELLRDGGGGDYDISATNFRAGKGALTHEIIVTGTVTERTPRPANGRHLTQRRRGTRARN